jgi:hypothetical protein
MNASPDPLNKKALETQVENLRQTIHGYGDFENVPPKILDDYTHALTVLDVAQWKEGFQ